MMVEAHRMICPVQNKKVFIDLPADFPETVEVEVIVLSLSRTNAPNSDKTTQEWLDDIWGCVPDFDPSNPQYE